MKTMLQNMKRRISGASETAAKVTTAPSATPAKPAAVAGVARQSRVGKRGDEPVLEALPLLKDCAANDRAELFRKKLALCSVVFDFNNAQSQEREKDIKRATLLEILEHVNNARNVFTEANMGDVVAMVSANIFRSLPPSKVPVGPSVDPEDEEPVLDPAWAHLQVVYEFFLRFVLSNDVDAKVAKRQIDTTFILRFLDLFLSDDPRERDYLKTILHRIYGKFMALRAFVRKSIQHVFVKLIYETESHNGIAELLEILGSIINGFALPLKDEHKSFLERALIPLHKARMLHTFHQQLSYCMLQYVEKDPRLAEVVIAGLLKFWPVTNSPKEVLFISEVEEVLERTQPAEFQRIQIPLFKQIARCINSVHFQVAERALFLWNNNHIVTLVSQNRQALFPVILPALYRTSKGHWNQSVHGLTYNVLKLMMDTDSPLFDECSSKHRLDEEKQKAAADERAKRWQQLEAAAPKYALV